MLREASTPRPPKMVAGLLRRDERPGSEKRGDGAIRTVFPPDPTARHAYHFPMNRRHFTALLASLPVTYSLPSGLSAATASQSASVPAGTYAWAQLIARAQNRCSPAMLARHLRLDATAAQQLFDEMLRDGVLRAPSVTGIARAAQPINTNAVPTSKHSFSQLGDALLDEEPTPLAKDVEPCLGCDDLSAEEETPDASPDKPVQESPQSG